MRPPEIDTQVEMTVTHLLCQGLGTTWRGGMQATVTMRIVCTLTKYQKEIKSTFYLGRKSLMTMS